MVRLLLLAVALALVAACTELTSDADLQATVEAAVDAALAERESTPAAGTGESSRTGISEEGVRTPASTIVLPGARSTFMFIKIGTIDGESRDAAHGGWIDVVSWSWGATSSGASDDPAAGLGDTTSGAGAVQVGDMVVTKYIDKASPKLYQALATGEHIPLIDLVFSSTGEQPVEYFVVTMRDVIVTSISSGGSDGDRPTEAVTLNFAEVKVEYTELDHDGKSLGAPTGYELAKTSHDTAKAIIQNVR